MYSKELLKGTLQPIILNLLKENGRMYGYEITQKVKELTKGKIEITEGALYPTLHKLESDGVLRVEEEFIGKRIRKYYLLTETGTKEVRSRVKEVNEFLETIGLLLNPKLS
ncbi:MAG TPA: PadR family transcriptional regulator [Bacteroidia bacterium]